jgi:hypothetical protein
MEVVDATRRASHRCIGLRGGYTEEEEGHRETTAPVPSAAGHPDHASTHPRRRPAQSSRPRTSAETKNAPPANLDETQNRQTPSYSSTPHKQLQDRIWIATTGGYSEASPLVVHRRKGRQSTPHNLASEPHHPGTGPRPATAQICAARTMPRPPEDDEEGGGDGGGRGEACAGGEQPAPPPGKERARAPPARTFGPQIEGLPPSPQDRGREALDPRRLLHRRSACGVLVG